MSDDKRKKKRGRNNKLTLRSCFRSSFTPDDNIYSDARNYNKNGRLGKPVMIAVSGKKRLIPDVNNLVNVDSYSKRSRSPPRRCISRLLKTVLFNSLMVKKIANSSSKSPDTSESNLLVEKIDKSNDDNFTNGRDRYMDTDKSSSRHRSKLHSSSSSRTTSSSYSSSSFSSNNSNSQSSSDQKTSTIDLLDFGHLITFNYRAFIDQKVSSRKDQPYRYQDSTVLLPLDKPKPMNYIRHLLSFGKGLSRLADSVDSRNSVSLHPAKVKSNGKNWNIRWCLFIFLSLVVLMLYGRIYSILCTSTWFYFVPCRKIKKVNSVSNAVKFFDTDSEQYKKRVIMAGLLDRTRNPLR